MSTVKAMVTDAYAAATIDDTGCEYLGRDIAQIEAIAKVNGSEVIYLVPAAFAQAEQPVAYSFRLATAIQHHENGSKEYCNFDKEPRLSLTPPCVPKDSIRDYTPLYAHPPSKREETPHAPVQHLRVKPLTDDEIMEIIKEVAPWKDEPKLNDLLTYEKSVPLFPQATYDVPSYRAEKFVRAVERRVLAALEAQPPAPNGLARPLSDWHEGHGFVTWWKFPVNEPSYIGSPLCDDWPGYHTHWTPHPGIPANADALTTEGSAG